MVFTGFRRRNGTGRVLEEIGWSGELGQVRLFLPRSDSALTGFTGIHALSGTHAMGFMRFEATRKGDGSDAERDEKRRDVQSQVGELRASVGARAAGARGFGLPSLDLPVTRSGAVYSTSAATAAEDVRQRILRYIRSLPREDQILIHQMYNAYKDHFGLLYIHIRPLDNSDGLRVIIKAGRTDNLERRMGQYSKCGPGILWISCYPTEYAKATERIIHLQFEIAGAKIQPFLCACKTKHHEYSCYEAAGELEGAERVVQAALRSLGQEAYRLDGWLGMQRLTCVLVAGISRAAIEAWFFLWHDSNSVSPLLL
ncbi:hypothetical protein DFH08DRAFT_823901 [Mycena albidolilacea]|uniref:Bacteriophage T5 Orf172 DNA-binding domain-containing protein n=1 Tax=Mycena albidolilacea TaxID=1033008 RepID=A0AAD6Z6H8_9AGAR|nr:hypothetical protein DFH08DRAFT_823901 [Mycena albidolilacea]